MISPAVNLRKTRHSQDFNCELVQRDLTRFVENRGIQYICRGILGGVATTDAMRVGLKIEHWSFWSPEAETPLEWRAYWRRQGAGSRYVDIPAHAIPVAHRRRMSSLSRMAIQAGLSTRGGTSADFAVFCSQHGELQRTMDLLGSMAKGLELSPTAFSQSVHNSSAGLFSIIAQSNAPATSLASGESTFAYGWLEAEAYIAEHSDASVLLVAFDEPLPSEYLPYCSQTQCSYAVALALRAAATDGVVLEPGVAQELDEHLPMAPLFLAWWLSGEPTWRLTADGEGWTWSRSANGT